MNGRLAYGLPFCLFGAIASGVLAGGEVIQEKKGSRAPGLVVPQCEKCDELRVRCRWKLDK